MMRRLTRKITLMVLGVVAFPAALADMASDREMAEALALTPNLENGRRLYQTCAVCHRPEGWGKVDGYYPQIAGQIHKVLIKQLEDIRGRHRDNPTMYPFTLRSVLGGAQEIADWCRVRLAPIKIPRYVVFVESLPQTATHRVAKFRLRGDKQLLAQAVDLEKH